MQSFKVDWTTKNAKVEFDESVLPAQKLAELIVRTPHMMGGDMRYEGWLALRVPELKDESKAKAAKEVLGVVAGVRRVTVFPAQGSVGVQFDAKGSVTSQQLIDVLGKAGIKAGNL